MEDLMEKLQSILSTKEGQSQLNNIASMLNMNGNGNNNTVKEQEPIHQDKTPDSGNGLDLSAIASMLSGMNNSNQAQDSNNSQLPNIDINMIMKLQQVFSSMNVNDKNSQLLKALKPHFGESRQKKVDQAISMMRLMSMLPMLKESGIFAGL